MSYTQPFFHAPNPLALAASTCAMASRMSSPEPAGGSEIGGGGESNLERRGTVALAGADG